MTPNSLAGVAVLVGVVLPAAAAALGLWAGGRHRPLAADFAVVGALAATAGAGLETWVVLRHGLVVDIPFLGSARTGGPEVQLSLRADQLSALTSIAVTVVALCVQIYSVAYLRGDGTPDAPTRYPGYAATVSLFTAAMMLVVHADDLFLLLIGWEVMGFASYLLIGHHSERPAARAAAVKAFLTTRVGDVGLVLAVVVLLLGAGTTHVTDLLAEVEAGQVGHGTLLAAALLALAGVLGKSAQFPLHTWLPDAMEGPTPISALIHAATMVAAGVYLVIRLLPIYLAVPGALQVAAVLAAITMVGAAAAALGQDDLKRLLAYSTISQVAYMLAAVAVTTDDGAQSTGAQAGLFHLLSHAAFKALLFLAAGCVVHLIGSTLLADMGGLLRSHPPLAVLFGLGLAGLAGLPPFGGFWSKEAVLTAADEAARSGMWTGWVVLLAGLTTSLLTGLYAGRAWSMVALGPSPLIALGDAETEKPHKTLAPGEDTELLIEDEHLHLLPRAMTWPLYLLAVPTVLLGLVLLRPPRLLGDLHVDLYTAFTGVVLALAGVGWAVSAPRLGDPDIAVVLPAGARAWMRDGFRVEEVQRALVVRPVQALAVAVRFADRDVLDAYVRGVPVLARGSGRVLRLASTGSATGYVTWVMAGAVIAGAAGIAGLVLT